MDRIYGGQGNDYLIGGFGSDFLWGDRFTISLYEADEDGLGHDTIDSVTDSDPVGWDEIWSGAGNDLILAKDGAGQIMNAGSGQDVCQIDKEIDFQNNCEVVS